MQKGIEILKHLLICFFIAQHESRDQISYCNSRRPNDELPWIGYKKTKYPKHPKTYTPDDKGPEFYYDARYNGRNSAHQHDHRIHLPVDLFSKHHQGEYDNPEREPQPGADS